MQHWQSLFDRGSAIDEAPGTAIKIDKSVNKLDPTDIKQVLAGRSLRGCRFKGIEQ